MECVRYRWEVIHPAVNRISKIQLRAGDSIHWVEESRVLAGMSWRGKRPATVPAMASGYTVLSKSVGVTSVAQEEIPRDHERMHWR